MNNKHIIKANFLKTIVDDSIRNVGLDMVRGICVLLIIIAHTNNILKTFLPVYKLLYPVGEMAQDLFFALSGYLIGGQILKMTAAKSFGKKELLRFYLKRWIRTIPFYFIFLIVNLLLFYFVYRQFGPGFTKFDFKVWPYFVFSQNFLSAHPPFFPEIWPIPVEEWSYILLPLPFLMFTGFFTNENVFKRKLGYLILLIIFIQGLRMLHIHLHHPETDWGLRKIVVYRLDALVYGFILALLTQTAKIKDHLNRHRLNLLFLGSGLLLISLFFNKILSKDIYNMLLFIYQPFACTLLLPYFIFRKFKSNFITTSFTHLSLTGYAILLSHLYCLQFLFITFCPVGTFLPALLTTLTYLAVLVVFSTFFYNRVERPILLMRKK